QSPGPLHGRGGGVHSRSCRLPDAGAGPPGPRRRRAGGRAPAGRGAADPGGRGEVYGDGASALLVELAELLALPVFSEHFPAFLALPSTHPHYLGLYAPGHPVATQATLVLGVGCRMFVEPDYPKGAMLPPGAAVIHVH